MSVTAEIEHRLGGQFGVAPNTLTWASWTPAPGTTPTAINQVSGMLALSYDTPIGQSNKVTYTTTAINTNYTLGPNLVFGSNVKFSNSTTSSNPPNYNVVFWPGNSVGASGYNLALQDTANNNIIIIAKPTAALTIPNNSNNNVIISNSIGSNSVGQTCSIVGGVPQLNGSNNTYMLGYNCTLTGGSNIALGSGAVTSGAGAIAMSQQNAATSAGTNTIAIGGLANATPSCSVVIGNFGTSDTVGEHVLSSGRRTANGDRQTSFITLWANTTDGTQTELGTNSGGNGAQDSFITLVNNATYHYTVNLIGRSTTAAGNDFVANYDFAIARDANAASTTLIGSVNTYYSSTRGTTTGWAVSITADTTNGRPAIKVTGAAATNISWVATVTQTKVK